jgi:hypothetical protein
MSEIEKVAAELLSKDFGLNQALSLDALQQALQERLVDYLLNDMEGLLQLLYRIDVDEKKVKQVFAGNQPKEIAPQLAALIIQRILQKAETRLKYRDL